MRRQAAAGAADKRGLQFGGMRRICGVGLRCLGERNRACRWLRPVTKSADAPVRAVEMGRDRGRRGWRSRGIAVCRTRWPGSRIWR